MTVWQPSALSIPPRQNGQSQSRRSRTPAHRQSPLLATRAEVSATPAAYKSYSRPVNVKTCDVMAGRVGPSRSI